MATKNNETMITETDMDLDAVLGVPGDSIMLADEQREPTKTVFTDLKPDLGFLNKPVVTEENPEDENPEDPEDSNDPENLEDLDNGGDEFADPKDKQTRQTPDKGKGGRPNSLISVTKKLVDKGVLAVFEDKDDIDKYTPEEVEELIESNVEYLQKQFAEDFVNYLPQELRHAYEYFRAGGKDIKGMLKAVINTVDIINLDVNNEEDQRQIVRTHLNMTGWGSAEEIEDEINRLEDAGTLRTKAVQFKPTLDNKHKEIVDRRLRDQQADLEQRQKVSKMYLDSVYKTLEPGILNGLKLDPKTQNLLYKGLTQSNYPSSSGGHTNYFGYLIEQYQWVNPRHDLLAEALWLLADPDGYRNNIRKVAETETTTKTVRTLKTEQNNNRGVNAGEEPDDNGSPTRRASIPRTKPNFFKR